MDSSAYATLPRVVLENGSGYVKIGMAGNKKPPHVIPNCVGQPKKKASSHYTESHSSAIADQKDRSESHSTSESSSFISDSCYTLIEYFCNRPQINSLVCDPDRQRMVWDKYIGRSHLTKKDGIIFPGNYLSVIPESSSICLTEANLCPAQSRQLSAEIIFEDFGFPLACFLSSQTASSYFYQNYTPSRAKSDPVLYSYPDSTISTSRYSPINSHSVRKELDQRNSSKEMNLTGCLVVDCGFGSTHSVPFVNGIPIQNASLRTNSGGSQCNSYLKNIAAMRSVNLEFNELVVQHMKEESCYVSLDFDLELKAAKRLIKLYGTHLLAHQYILPIYTSKSKTLMSKHFTNYRKTTPPLLNENNEDLIKALVSGEISDIKQLEPTNVLSETNRVSNTHNSVTHDDTNDDDTDEVKDSLGEMNDINAEEFERDVDETQFVELFAERFSVPEIIFNPQDIKLNDCGIVELAYRSISLCPPIVQPLLASNIFICGGTTKFPGFIKRFYKDLRPMIPQEWDIRIYSTDDPMLASFYGARMWTNNDSMFLSNAITRSEYFENGASVIKIKEQPKRGNDFVL
uniref:Actin-related protein, putative n=1 Tax=Theileria annulata TaxID=5874 RepID=A0A3B0MI49_THEAN